MTLETPVSASPAAPQGRAAPRLLTLWLFLVTGFAMPVLACFGLMLVSVIALQLMSLGTPSGGLGRSSGVGPGVALIRVEGAIMSGESGPFDSGVAASGTIIQQIEEAKNDADVKAIVLMVNSPGGGVTASDEIYHALKNAGKPIVVMMGDMAASGGYYISMAADWIVANPNSLTGSIGVISEFPNAAGLLDKVGVDFIVITSGPRKDIGSPYREMTPAEKTYWQAIIDETYQGFVDVVAAGRKKSVEEIKPLADGGVYTGRQALELGLIDELGYESDAIAKAATLGGITGKPRLIEFQRAPTLMDLLNGMAQTRTGIPSLSEMMDLVGRPRLLMEWVR